MCDHINTLVRLNLQVALYLLIDIASVTNASNAIPDLL